MLTKMSRHDCFSSNFRLFRSLSLVYDNQFSGFSAFQRLIALCRFRLVNTKLHYAWNQNSRRFGHGFKVQFKTRPKSFRTVHGLSSKPKLIL